MNRSENIGQLAAALAVAQGQIEGASKESTNPFFKSKYADLTSVWAACRKALCSNGLSVLQPCRTTDDGIEVETVLAHSSGEWISETLSLPAAKLDAQGLGSAITYARRYSLAAMVGVCPEDDDGNAATDSVAHRKAQPPPTEPRALTPKEQGEFDRWVKIIEEEATNVEALNANYHKMAACGYQGKLKSQVWGFFTEYAKQQGWYFSKKTGNFTMDEVPV